MTYIKYNFAKNMLPYWMRNMNWEESLSESIERANLPPTEYLTTTTSEQGSPRLQRPDPRITQSAPTTPTLVRKIDSCFGRFDGVGYDVSGLSPVQAFAKLSAVHMLTSARVGHVREDPTMAEARPRLSEINRKGFLTIDSQMGKKIVQQHPRTGADYPYWQRSYVDGLMPRHLTKNFHQRMELEDSVVILIDAPHDRPRRIGGAISVTLDGHYFFTRTPVATSAGFEESVQNVLPEVSSIMSDKKCKQLLREDAYNVRVVDMVWGRPFWLFDKISQVLDVVNDENASPPLPPIF